VVCVELNAALAQVIVKVMPVQLPIVVLWAPLAAVT
jgi:hypothetical protein